MKLNNKKYLVLLISSILVVVIATISITYAYLSFNAKQEGTNTLSSGCYNINFQENSNSINITGYPMSSTQAFKKITPYNFTITNTCDTPSNYQVIINVLKSSSSDLIPFINYSLDGTTSNKLTSLTPITLPNGIESTNVLTSYVLDTGALSTKNSTKNFNLYMWIDENAGNDIMGNTLNAQIVIYNTAG